MDAVFLLQNRIPSFINSRLCSKIENMPSFIDSRIFKGYFWDFYANIKSKSLQGNDAQLFQLLFETLKSRKKKFAVHNEFTFRNLFNVLLLYSQHYYMILINVVQYFICRMFDASRIKSGSRHFLVTIAWQILVPQLVQ